MDHLITLLVMPMAIAIYLFVLAPLIDRTRRRIEAEHWEKERRRRYPYGVS